MSYTAFRRWAIALTALVSVLVLASCPDGAVEDFDPSDYVGTWTGSWHNTTFSSTGAATMTVTTDEGAKTLSALIDLNGNVFGGGDPAALTVNGTYTASGLTISQATALFGNLTLSGDADGSFSGTGTPPGFHALTFTGSSSSASISLSYSLEQPEGTIYAEGTLSLTK